MTLEPLLKSPPVFSFHVAAAVAALALGLFMLAMRKGTPLHRGLGWIWVITMFAIAISSFWITGMIPGHFSPIHILSIITLIALPAGIWLRRRGNIRAHAITMISTFSGLIIAGAFTLLPGRVMHDMFFGP